MYNLKLFTSTEQESPQKHPSEMCSPASPGAPPSRRPTKHPQTRRWSVQQGAPTRFQSPQIICHQRRLEEDARDQSRARMCLGGIHQHNQQLLPRRNCQVSCGYN